MDDALPSLNAAEVRVLGALIEKQITTPDYYPLSLNALSNACNQLTNRDPVVAYDDGVVLKAIDGLRDKRLATLFHGAESRVAKYRHALGDVILLTPAEVALLCVLMLRGPQTVGELRTRCERLFAFDNLGEVEAALSGMMNRQPPLVARLPRAPGTKESRYAHLLGGPVDPGSGASPATAVAPANPEAVGSAAAPAEPDRTAQLAAQVEALRREIAQLREEFAAFRQQFE